MNPCYPVVLASRTALGPRSCKWLGSRLKSVRERSAGTHKWRPNSLSHTYVYPLPWLEAATTVGSSSVPSRRHPLLKVETEGLEMQAQTYHWPTNGFFRNGALRANGSPKTGPR